MALKEDKEEALQKGQKGTVKKALGAEDRFYPRGYFPWGRLRCCTEGIVLRII